MDVAQSRGVCTLRIGGACTMVALECSKSSPLVRTSPNHISRHHFSSTLGHPHTIPQNRPRMGRTFYCGAESGTELPPPRRGAVPGAERGRKLASVRNLAGNLPAGGVSMSGHGGCKISKFRKSITNFQYYHVPYELRDYIQTSYEDWILSTHRHELCTMVGAYYREA